MRVAYVLGLYASPEAASRPSTVAHDSWQNADCNELWKELIILDTFSAACLGRPECISREICGSISVQDKLPGPDTYGPCLEANVHTSQTIRAILKMINHENPLAVDKATNILNQIGYRTEGHCDSDYSPYALARLSSRLFKNYAVMLLARPFLIQEFRFSQRESRPPGDSVHGNLSKEGIWAAQDTIERLHCSRKVTELSQCDMTWW